MLELEVFCRDAILRANESLKHEMRVLERSDSKLGCHSPFKMSDDASLFCLFVSGKRRQSLPASVCLGSCPLAARFMGGFWAFNGFQEIPISTFGHSNACHQSRRADCGFPHACLRSSAACAFCGILCVLDGFVLKCPKVETMNLDGVEIPGSVNYGGARSPSCGAPGPLLWCAELVLAVHGIVVLCLPGATIKFARAGGDDQICLRGANKKDAPKGALHANKFPRRGAPRLRR